jgi:serine/threonine protein kinase
MVARTIGKYRFVEKIGRGGMGTVYRAVDETLERDVAIKVLNSDITEPEVLRRFRAEAVTLARLNHPGIATLHDLYQENGDLFMVMEFVRGETLQRLSERWGPMPLEQATALGVQALDALAYAHRLGIVHRDLKPSNLMLTDTGLVKVMDFGIARIVGSEHLTCDGSMMGTPAYMAPEQVRGGEIDGRADLYSMAVVLYRLLAAKLPFEADTAIALAQKQLYDPPTPLKLTRPDLPVWCEAVLDRALAKSPHDRFQRAEEFKDALVSSVGSLLNSSATVAFISDAPTCTMPTPVAIPREASRAAESKRQTGSRALSQSLAASDTDQNAGSREITPATQRTVVISGKYFFATTAVLAFLLIAVLAAVLIVARRPLGIPAADQIVSRLAPPAERSAPPAPAPQPRSDGPVQGSQAIAPNPAAAESLRPAPLQADLSKKPAQSPAGPSGVPNQVAAPAVSAVTNTSKAPGANAIPKPTGSAVPAPTAAANKPAGAAAATSGERSGTARMLPSLSFERLKLLVIEGTRSREQDAKIHLADGRIIIIAVGERLVASFPYEDVLTLSSSRSRQPRWRNADGTDSGAVLPGGAFGLFKSDRTWLAMQTRAHTYVVRADRDQIEPLVHAASDRTGLTIVHVTGK